MVRKNKISAAPKNKFPFNKIEGNLNMFFILELKISGLEAKKLPKKFTRINK